MTTSSPADHPLPESGPVADPWQRLAALPWWRRPRRLRRQLAVALVITALLAVATFGGLNFFAARELLFRGTEQQLAASGAARATTIQAGADRLLGEIAVTSSSLATARAVDAFTGAFADLESRRLTKQQRAELAAWYRQRVVEPLESAGLGPVALDDVVPDTRAAQWVQYHYTLREPGEPPPVDAGDGTRYSRLNAEFAPVLQEMSDARGGGDVLLIDDAGTIVYSLDKSIDVGTNLITGPYAQTALGQLFTERLPRARVGTPLLTDFSVSADGQPALYAVSAVRSGERLAGAYAVEIPVAAVNQITNASGGSHATSAEDSDTYLVASNGLLQSEPRAWIEDPDGYLDRLRGGDEADQAEARLIELFGSPVGIQQVDTVAVQAALDGRDFRGSARNYFGDPTFAASESFSPGGRQWVVVTEVPRAAVRGPLQEYLLRILVVLVVILPIVAALGIWTSRLFTRPIRPTVEAAEAIVAGDREPDVDTSRRDEFGDLGRRLTAMADSLAAHERQLADEYERTRQLLLAVLPPQLVDDDGKVIGTGEAIEPATAVAVTVAPTYRDDDQENLREALGRAADLAEQIARSTGLERVRVSADRYLFVAGIGSDGTGADAAIDFADQFRRRLPDVSEVPLDVHVGLSSGVVATGVLDSGSLTFGAWGDPVRRALALSSLARVDAVLIDASTTEAAAGRWPLVRAHDIVDLDDVPMDLFALEPDQTRSRSARG